MKRLFFTLITCCILITVNGQRAKLPVIGISATDNSEGFSQVRATYINSVLRAGGVPVVLPITDNPEVIKTMIASIDALILTGGEDIEPIRYSEEPLPKLETIHPERDEFDILLIKYATERQIPIFGICRGHQLLNVAFGGTLYQDLATQVKSEKLLKHRQQAPIWHGTHQVALEENSVLSKVLGKTVIMANSYHHQAVKDVAPDFVITGRTSDGVVEAMEMKGNPKVFSVQFHPENATSHGLDDFLSIFVYLVELAIENQ
ncbi:MAG: gamma-glutamyl-gamma-aminobutyrate hydrolase family protein [Bacteroidales bacterium]|nr:gamma-glutamyl-gamma-aminobutyrate hydrolase family protein [Bacteroidales bacterium]MCL2132896.1 gamma-glutamyl-gamma-aminobutyrate hydrolase family protein [Bacteroidales bacterium]